MVGSLSLFKSMSNLGTAIVLFACLVLGAALLMSGGEPGKNPTAQPPVVLKRPETQTETKSAAAGTAGRLERETRIAASKPIETAEKTAHSPAAGTSALFRNTRREPKEKGQENAETAPANLGNQAQTPAAPTTIQQSEQTQAVLLENSSDDFPRSYKVQQGDSLSGIAHKLLGAANRWPDIARANNITEHDWIHPGQELIIPAKAERIGSADARR